MQQNLNTWLTRGSGADPQRQQGSKDVDFKSIDNQKDFNQAQQDLNDRVSKLPQENQDNISN